MLKLTIEQQFNFESFKVYAKGLSEEETKKRLVALYREMIEKDNAYKALIKKEWGL